MKQNYNKHDYMLNRTSKKSHYRKSFRKRLIVHKLRSNDHIRTKKVKNRYIKKSLARPREVNCIIVYEYDYSEYPLCPRCRNPIEYEFANYCSYCGQKLAWSNFKLLCLKDGSVCKEETKPITLQNSAPQLCQIHKKCQTIHSIYLIPHKEQDDQILLEG